MMVRSGLGWPSEVERTTEGGRTGVPRGKAVGMYHPLPRDGVGCTTSPKGL